MTVLVFIQYSGFVTSKTWSKAYLNSLCIFWIYGRRIATFNKEDTESELICSHKGIKSLHFCYCIFKSNYYKHHLVMKILWRFCMLSSHWLSLILKMLLSQILTRMNDGLLEETARLTLWLCTGKPETFVLTLTWGRKKQVWLLIEGPKLKFFEGVRLVA